MQRHGAVRRRRGGGAGFQAAEGVADRRFHGDRIDVADDDDGDALGAIPGVVEVAQSLHGGRAQDVRLADGRAVGIARLVVEHRRLLVAHAAGGTQPAAPFLDDDTAFLVHLLGVERQPAREVGHCIDTATHDLLRLGRQVEHVDRFVEAGVGVDVRPEARAGRLEERHELARLEVRAPVERHVFDEVRQSLLVVGLVERPGLHGQTERHTIGRTGVRADEIGQAVRQSPGADRGVERDAILERERGGRRWRRLRACGGNADKGCHHNRAHRAKHRMHGQIIRVVVGRWSLVEAQQRA